MTNKQALASVEHLPVTDVSLTVDYKYGVRGERPERYVRIYATLDGRDIVAYAPSLKTVAETLTKEIPEMRAYRAMFPKP